MACRVEAALPGLEREHGLALVVAGLDEPAAGLAADVVALTHSGVAALVDRGGPPVEVGGTADFIAGSGPPVRRQRRRDPEGLHVGGAATGRGPVQRPHQNTCPAISLRVTCTKNTAELNVPVVLIRRYRSTVRLF